MRLRACPRPRQLLGSPALHFLMLGSALYLGELWLAEIRAVAADSAEAPQQLTLSVARREQLRGRWQLLAGRLPDAGEEEWLIRQWADEEMLYREALRLGLDRDDPGVCRRLAVNLRFLQPQDAGSADPQTLCHRARELGLDRGDPVIRRQMAELMRILLKRSPGPGTPLSVSQEAFSHDELEDYVSRHRERFVEPAHVLLSHVFLSRAERGAVADRDARRLLERLAAAEVDPRQAAAAGDPFLAGHHPPASSERDLERIFGPDFAKAAVKLPIQRWSGPVRSAYGLHLVWVHERRPERLPPLDRIRQRAILGLEAERAEMRLETALARLRMRWQIRVDEPPARS